VTVSSSPPDQPTFHGTSWTHEVVIDGQTRAYAESLDEAKVVACAISRVTGRAVEVRVYAAFDQLPKASFVTGWIVR